MPAVAAVAGAIGAGLASVVGITLAATSVAAIVIGAVAVIGVVALATKAIKKKQQQRRAQQASISGVLVTKAGSTSPIPVVYGQRRIAGQRVFIASDGTTNKYLHIVESLCEGPIEGITEIYFADELAASSSDNGATWDFSVGNFDGFIDVYFADGSQTTALNGHTFSNLDNIDEHDDWPSTAVGNDTAYVYLVAKFDNDKFAGGLPALTYTVKGKKVPQIGSAYNSTKTYSQDPARIIYDYMIAPYGKEIPYTLLDTTTFNAASTYNNQRVDKSDADATQVTRYLCNAYVDTATPMLENLEELFTTCRAGLITGDTYKLIQDKPTSDSGFTINDDNIVGNITFVAGNKRTLLNGVRAKFPNEETDFNYQEDIATLESTTLQGSSYDGLKLVRDIELQNTTDKYMVDRILTEEINQARQSGVVQCKVDPSLIDLTVGDVVNFTNSTLGQTNKKYRIIKTVIRNDHTIDLDMREYDPNVYWDNNQSIIVNNKNDTDH